MEGPVILWLIACTKTPPPPPVPPLVPAWLEVEPGKGVCISPVPAAGDMDAADRAGYEAALGALQQSDLPGAEAALAPLSDHPGVRDLRAVVGLLKGEPTAADTLVELADAHPEDACLNSTAALANAARGGDGAKYLLTARAAAPDDPRIAFLSWYMGAEEGAAVLPALEKGLAASPDHPGYLLAVGVTRYEAGDTTGIPLVARAVDAGMSEGIGVLLFAYHTEHQRAEYLRLASKIGLLGDDGRVAAAPDPEVAYKAEIGQVDDSPLVARFDTSLGTFDCTLLPESAPISVASFVGLAKGSRPWVDPRDGEIKQDQPLYDGTGFHRVIPDFMIQGGDPTGTGTGDPGFRYLDELDPEQRFDQPGVLALANMGPNTNGCQFFVTEAPVPHLDGRHTIIGKCDEAAVKVVKKIARVPRDEDDRPVEPVTLEKVTISSAPPKN